MVWGDKIKREARPRKILVITLFSSQEGYFCDIERALQTGNFCSFAEKNRGLDPQGPPSCAPATYAYCMNLLAIRLLNEICFPQEFASLNYACKDET